MTKTADSRWPVRKPVALGIVALGALFVLLGAWGTGTEIAGAVVAPGRVAIENNRQVIQHSEGGVVDEVLARDGDAVKAGKVLLRLDGSLIADELRTVEKRLIELRARRARLEAERDGRERLEFPTTLLRNAGSVNALTQIDGQRALFKARKESIEQELAQLRERIRQSAFRVEGLQSRLSAVQVQRRLIEEELSSQLTLLKRGLVPKGRVTELEKDKAVLEGNAGLLSADIAAVQGEMAAFEIERLRLVSDRRQAAIVAIRDIGVDEFELERQHSVLQYRLSKVNVRSPVDGVVYGSTVFGPMAVLRGAETLMYIVPSDRPLVIEARVPAVDVDDVYVGQTANLRFPAFNQRVTPEVGGVVASLSADAFMDEQTGAFFFEVKIAPDAGSTASISALELLPGMPVEALIRREDRTPLSYLVKPLTDYFNRAFRES